MCPPLPSAAFISTLAALPPTSRPLRRARCALRARRKPRPARLRCAMPREGTEEPQPRAERVVDIADPAPQVEGALSMDALAGLDAGLEAALTKGWSRLETFGLTEDIGDELEEEGKEGENEEEKGEKGGEEDEKKEKKKKKKVRSKKVIASDDVKREEQQAARQRKKAQGGLSRADLESEAAIAAINEAKTTGKKRRGRKPSAAAKDTATKKKSAAEKESDQDGDEKQSMTLREKLNSEVWDATPRWFFLQVKPGCEQSTAISIRNMAHSLKGLDVTEVLVPTTEILRLTKGGKSVKKEERIFPGYILVLMVMNRQNYADVQRVPNVQWFMGDPNRDKKSDDPFRPPLPVSDAEMKVVFEKVKVAASAKPEVKTAIRPGDSIRVISGTFEGHTGRVSQVKPDLNIVIANLLIFGRETATELDMEQVQVIDDTMNPRLSEEEEEKEEEARRALDAVDNIVDATPSRTVSESGSYRNAIVGRVSAGDVSETLVKDTSDESTTLPARRDTENKSAFSFLSDIDDSSKPKKRASDSKKDPLFGSDDELAAFLASDDDSDVWKPSESRVPSAALSKSAKASPRQGGEAVDNDDLFKFLDSVELNEADPATQTARKEPEAGDGGTSRVASDVSDGLDYSDDDFEEASIVADLNDTT